MHDVGYYDDAARLAQLAMRLLQNLRIVLDMELQSGELGYEAAVLGRWRLAAWRSPPPAPRSPAT